MTRRLEETKTRRLALDPGFGGFKIAEVVDGATLCNVIPATVGLGRIADMGLLTAGIRRSHKAQDKPLQIDIDGQGFLVGRNVHKHTEPSNRLDFQRLADGPELRALVYAALASRMNGGPYTASVLMGLPVEVMRNRSLALQTLHALRSWLVGGHRFMANGVPYELQIVQIKGMGQPLGTYFAFGMNGSGQWDDERVDWNAPAAMADIGFNTLDLFGIQGGVLVNRFTDGENRGMHRAARRIIKQVKERFGVGLSLDEADEMIRQHTAGQAVRVYHPGGSEAVGELVQAALSQTFGEVNEFIRSHLDDIGFRYFLISGGGAEALKPWLVKEYPQAVILPDPVTANASGLAKFAADPAVWS